MKRQFTEWERIFATFDEGLVSTINKELFRTDNKKAKQLMDKRSEWMYVREIHIWSVTHEKMLNIIDRQGNAPPSHSELALHHY